MRLALVAALLLIVTSSVVACSGLPDPRFAAEEPAGSGTWVEIAGRPAWVEAPPARAEHLRFVATGRSNVCSIVLVNDGPRADRDAAEYVLDRLTPVLGTEAASAAAARATENLHLLERAHRSEILTRELTPGNTLCTAWALWEVAIADVLADVPEERHEAAWAALLAE